MLLFLPKSEENMVLPIRNLQNSTRQDSSDAELHCTGEGITLPMKSYYSSYEELVRA